MHMCVHSYDNFDNMDWVIPTNYVAEELEIKYVVVGQVQEPSMKSSCIIKFGML